MTSNWVTLVDVLGCLRAVATFAPLLLMPGHCLAWVTNLAGFRRRGANEQAVWSVALSFAVLPVAAVMLGRYGTPALAWCAVMVCALMAIGLNARALRQDKTRRFRWRLVAGIALGLVWAGFVIAELVDVGVGSQLYLSVTIFDHALRTAFVDSVLRTGVPPANPLYWPGHPAPMRYYYFWYVLTAASARLAGATARQAMVASVAWAGFGLAAVVTLYCRHFLGADSAEGKIFGSRTRRWPRTAVAIALLAVTGLDILPALAKAILRLPTDPDMEWWSPDQVSSWMDSLLWVPHHIAGLVCCLFGFLLVWMAKGLSINQRVACAGIAGLSFASAFGLSTWVAVAFAMVMFAWMLWALWREPGSRQRVPVLLGAGLIAALALMPYLIELRHADSVGATLTQGPVSQAAESSIAGNASHLLRFGVRHMIDPDCLRVIPWFADLARSHPRREDSIAGLVLLLPGYFVELGFYGLVLVVALRAMRGLQLNEATRASIVLACAGLLVSTFLRSTVIANNDFGIRSILIAQFFLLLLAVRWCEGAFGVASRPLRVTMLAMVWVGLAGTVYQVIGLRLYLPIEERLGRPDEAGLAERAMALRRGFDAMDRRIPKSAVIQFNTAQPSDYFRYAQLMQGGRQMATAFPQCASVFGGDASACPGVEQGAARLFSLEGGAALSAFEGQDECGRLGIDYLVATRWDAVWLDSAGWVWKLPAVVDTGDLRVLNCAAPAR